MLKPGAVIHVVAPAGAVDGSRIEAGADVLRGWGYRVELDASVGASCRYLAGSDQVRLESLRRAARAAEVEGGAVWMARGGFGLARLLPSLLADPLPPVPFLGFSDGTVWLNHHRGPAIHAPVLNSMVGHIDEGSLDHLRRVLTGEKPPLIGTSWVPGEASGGIVGGNLCVLASLAGTPGALNSQGCIVALEDLGEAPYKIDRLLTQLGQSGAFDGAVGFALGTFLGAEPPAGSDWTLRDVLLEHLAPLCVPVLGDLPFGHGTVNHAFGLGAGWIGGGELRWGMTEHLYD